MVITKCNTFHKFSVDIIWKFMDISSQAVFLVSGIASIFIVTIFLVTVATGIILLVLIYQKRQLQYLREKEQLKVSYEKEILTTQLEIQEQTFKNISQEIHDNIGQVLSLVKLNIYTLDNAPPQAFHEKLDNSKELITKAIQDLRDLSKSMNTDYISELDLVRSIEYELEMIQKTGTYKVEFNTNGKAYRLNRQEELVLFRIVQEVLHNIIRHAKANAIYVKAMFDKESFALQIADNGKGFDASRISSNNLEGLGLGIRNMHNRAKMINADFKLSSTLQKGTTVTVVLPLTQPKP